MSINEKSKRFLKNEDGAVTVESTLWIAFLFLFIVAILDLCMYFFSHSWAIRALHQENRKYIVGEYSSCEELVTNLNARIRVLSPSAESICGYQIQYGKKISIVAMTLVGRELGLGLSTFFADEVTVSTSGLQVVESPNNAADAGGGTTSDDGEELGDDIGDVIIEVGVLVDGAI